MILTAGRRAVSVAVTLTDRSTGRESWCDRCGQDAVKTVVVSDQQTAIKTYYCALHFAREYPDL